jgi:hypothetical protein
MSRFQNSADAETSFPVEKALKAQIRAARFL